MKNFYTIINQTQNKGELKKLIDWFIRNYGNIRTAKLLDKLKLLGFENSTLSGISIGINDLLIPPSKASILQNSTFSLKKNKTRFDKGKINKIRYLEKTINIWNQTNEKLKDEILKIFRESNTLNPLLIMTLSGARGNISQVKQLVGMRGLMSDSQGEIIDLPIKNNFKEGLNLTEYFISCYGARKGLIDTALKTANSGYLTRRLIFVAQNQIIKKSDCKTIYMQAILNLKKSKNEYNINKQNLIGRVLAKEIYFKNTEKIIAGIGQDICNYLLNKILLAKKIYIRSPLTCQLNSGICQLCYGWNLGKGKLAELGESVGIIAAQSIGEPGTQLTMRTFHTGGIFSGKAKKQINAPHKGTIFFTKKLEEKRVLNNYGETAILSKESKIIAIRENKINISKIKLPINSLIFVKPKQKIYDKQLIAEIKKEKTKRSIGKKDVKEILSPLSGLIDLSKEEKNSYIYIISYNLVEIKIFYKKYKNRFPSDRLISLQKEKKSSKKKYIKVVQLNKNSLKINAFKKVIKTNKKKYSFFYTVEKNIQKQHELVINKKLTEKYIRKQKKNKNIGNVKNFWFKKYSSLIIQKRNSKIFLIKKVFKNALFENSKLEQKKQTIKRNTILYYSNYKQERNQDIVQGLPKIEQLLETRKISNFEKVEKNPHEKLRKIFKKLEKKYPNKIAVRISIEKIQQYLLKEIQNVYKSQGVIIANKHFELIIKEITSKVLIKKQGQTPILPGEIIELNKIEKLNQKIGKKASYEPILLGISKLSLTSKSFISAASFQETAKILSKAAIAGKIDWLHGLKENIILSKLIPIGTGYKNKRQ